MYFCTFGHLDIWTLHLPAEHWSGLHLNKLGCHTLQQEFAQRTNVAPALKYTLCRAPMQPLALGSSESRWVHIVHIVHCTTSVMQQYGAEKMTSVNLPKRRLSANFMKIQIGGAGTSLDKKWQKCLTRPADMCLCAPLMDTNNQVSRVTPSS